MNAPTRPGPVWPTAVFEVGPIRVTAIRTGSVAVKAAHRAYGGPAALAAIALDPRWTPWLPVTCWLIEHPDGPIVVDTGETARTAEPGYFDCDPATAFVYERLLRFDIPEALEAGPQLRSLGIPPEEVRTVALTHLHSDHAGGLGHFPNAAFYTSRTEAEHPPGGAVRCRWPAFFRPTPVDYGDARLGAFERTHALTADGAVRLVPTPGHTRGHQSVIVHSGGTSVFLAGDASFSLGQVERRIVAGICEDRTEARRTLDLVAEHLAETGAHYLAAHEAP